MARVASIALVVALAASACNVEALEIGAKAPAFKAQGVDGKEHTLDGLKDAKAVVVCFTCNSCPVAVAYEDRFIEFAKAYKASGVRFVAINVSPESLDDMKAEEKGFPFPYVKDESGETALAYGAKVTPHLFVLDGERKVAYMGAFDEQSSGKQHVRAAVDAVLAGKTPETTTTRPFGCGIRIRR